MYVCPCLPCNLTTNIENRWFFRKPEISISMARATFLDENVNKNIKHELLNVVYGCLDVNFADAGHGNGPSLHTHMGPCRFRDLRNFHVCLLFLALHRGNWLWPCCAFAGLTFFLPPQLVTYKDNYIVLVYFHFVNCVFATPQN